MSMFTRTLFFLVGSVATDLDHSLALAARLTGTNFDRFQKHINYTPVESTRRQ